MVAEQTDMLKKQCETELSVLLSQTRLPPGRRRDPGYQVPEEDQRAYDEWVEQNVSRANLLELIIRTGVSEEVALSEYEPPKIYPKYPQSDEDRKLLPTDYHPTDIYIPVAYGFGGWGFKVFKNVEYTTLWRRKGVSPILRERIWNSQLQWVKLLKETHFAGPDDTIHPLEELERLLVTRKRYGTAEETTRIENAIAELKTIIG